MYVRQILIAKNIQLSQSTGYSSYSMKAIAQDFMNEVKVRCGQR
jgi:hypothetical protein